MIHKILNDHKNHQTIRFEGDKRICKHTQGSRNCPKGTDTHASKKLQWSYLQRSWSYGRDSLLVKLYEEVRALYFSVELGHGTFCLACSFLMLLSSSLSLQNRLWGKERDTTYKTHETLSPRHIRLLMPIRNALTHHKTRNDFPMVHALETQHLFGVQPPKLMICRFSSPPSKVCQQPPTWHLSMLIHIPPWSVWRQGKAIRSTWTMWVGPKRVPARGRARHV